MIIKLFDEKKRAIKLLNGSISCGKNLRKAFITIGKYCKHIGLNKERTSDLVLDWLKKQNCSSEFDSVIKDLEKAVNSVYKKDYIFIHDINVKIFKNEVDFINELKSRGEKNIAFSLLYLSKIFGNSFYCYHQTLHRLTKLSIRHIKRVIKKLEAYGFIDIIRKDKGKKIIFKNGKAIKRYSYPNTYKIKIDGEGEVICLVGDIEDIFDLINLIK